MAAASCTKSLTDTTGFISTVSNLTCAMGREAVEILSNSGGTTPPSPAPKQTTQSDGVLCTAMFHHGPR